MEMAFCRQSLKRVRVYEKWGVGGSAVSNFSFAAVVNLSVQKMCFIPPKSRHVGEYVYAHLEYVLK